MTIAMAGSSSYQRTHGGPVDGSKPPHLRDKYNKYINVQIRTHTAFVGTGVEWWPDIFVCFPTEKPPSATCSFITQNRKLSTGKHSARLREGLTGIE